MPGTAASELAQWAESAAPTVPRRRLAGLRQHSSRVRTTYDNNNLIEEKTHAVYIQWYRRACWAAMPDEYRIGIRYEKTDLESTSLSIPDAIRWLANNDFVVERPVSRALQRKEQLQLCAAQSGLQHRLHDELKGRASFGKTIARAPYGNLYAGPGASTSGSVLFDDPSGPPAKLRTQA